MKLGLLLSPISKDTYQLFDSIVIVGISANSTHINPGYLFVAIPGYHVDGHDYIEDAIKSGAVAVVGEKEMQNLPVPYIKVKNSRLALAKLACQFYNHPSKKHIVIGVTGTNGKTTTSFMIKHILESAGKTCSLFGSIFNIVNGEASLSLTNTTLDALELQQQMAKSNDDVIIIEVSSHGLAQYRVEGIEFDYCLFTNLDQDHLDYHRSMEDYFSVKAQLFEQLVPNGMAIVNSYDGWGQKLALMLQNKGLNVLEFGKHHYYIHDNQSNSLYSCLLYAKDECVELKLQMLGIHNFKNAAMAFLTAKKFELTGQEIAQALETFRGVPGRFEMLKHPCGANFIIDYAHTADAFNQCLQTAIEMKAKKIIHIFGFRGDRDQEKRMHMLKVSRELSNLSILTFDDLNSISEEEMTNSLHHYNHAGDCLVIPDRTLAIKHAWEMAEEGDWIFITGKGHEIYQQSFNLPTMNDVETIEYLRGNS